MVVEYLDDFGHKTNKSELEEILQEKDPELSARYDQIAESLGNAKAYYMSLYIIPHEHEMKLLPLERIRWNQNIELFQAQYKLSEGIDLIESLKFVTTEKNCGDKVIVLKSSRPFADTLLEKHPQGSYEAWIGSLISNDVTNVKNAKFSSANGKIFRRVELANARKIPTKLAKLWVVGEIERMYDRIKVNHELAVEKLKDLALGKKEVVIYDEYQNTDIYCIEHIFSEDEKAAKDVEKPGIFSIKDKYFPQEGHFGWRRSNVGFFGGAYLDNESQHKWCTILRGNDERSPEDIYNVVKETVIAYTTNILDKKDISEIDFNISKKVTHQLTETERKKIENSYNPQNMLKYKLLEKGMEISDDTIICMYPTTKNGHIEQEHNAPLFKELMKILPHFKIGKESYSFGHGSSLTENQELDITSSFFFELEQFYGEGTKFY